MARQLPEFDLLSLFYLGNGFDAAAVRRIIGGAIDDPKLANTCVIRVSRSLNLMGHPLPMWTHAFRTRKGIDKRWYGLRVKEFWTYMTNTYGKPTVFDNIGKDNKPLDKKLFNGTQGIIGFRVHGWSDATGHFTLWDGSKLLYAGDPAHDYFAISHEVALWQAGTTRSSVAPY